MVLLVLKTNPAFPQALEPFLLAKVILFVHLVRGILLAATALTEVLLVLNPRSKA